MRALIFADRLGVELDPLSAILSVPLLPIVGKELLIYTIEELVGAGIVDLVVVVSAHGDQVGASILGDGQRWGASIRYVLSRGEEPPSTVWSRLNLLDGDAVLALRGDVLRSPATKEFLQQAQSKSDHCVCAAVGADTRGSLLLLRPGCPAPGDLLDCLSWVGPTPLPPGTVPWVPTAQLNCIEDLPAFHRANLDLLAGRIPGLAAVGRQVALGLSAGRRATVSPKSLKQGVAYVGANSRVHPEAELIGEVVIGDDVVVDRAATIRDSVILPRTYVGELLEVGNAIVSSNHLIRVDTGAVLRITEAFLLGDLSSQGGRAMRSRWDQVAGLLMLILSLPLWPLAGAAAALSGRGGLFGRRILIGNRPTIPTPMRPAGGFLDRFWMTPIPLLRHLPRLLAVIRGDLRLFGVSPLTPEETAGRHEDWQLVRDRAPVGLFGPTQLCLGSQAPLEERLLSDAFYTRDQGAASHLRLLLLALGMLFSRDAWQAASVAE
jgi:mannose-1-phosphate guanylyltransferase / phosphomannomutase